MRATLRATLRTTLAVLAKVIYFVTTTVPSTLMAVAFWIVVCDMALGLNWFFGFVLTFIFFNIWYWGGLFILVLVLVCWRLTTSEQEWDEDDYLEIATLISLRTTGLRP